METQVTTVPKIGSIATAENMVCAAVATADTAKQIAQYKGCANKDVVSIIAAANLAANIHQGVHSLNVVSRVVEHEDRHGYLRKNVLLTRPGEHKLSAHAVLKPLSCKGQLAKIAPADRASGTHLVLAPEGSLLKVDTSCHAQYLGLPPGMRAGPGGAQLHSSPFEIVEQAKQTFHRPASDVTVTILKRTWNDELAAAYRNAYAVVEEIPAGDYQSLAMAAEPVVSGARIRIAAGLGGVTEQLLAAVHYKSNGGTLMMQLIPAGMEMQADKVRGFVYDQDVMITSDDCFLVTAGVTDAVSSAAAALGSLGLVPGVRTSSLEGTCWVSVLAVSPVLGCHCNIVVEYDSDGPGRPTILEGISLDEHLLLRYLSLGIAIETRAKETSKGDREGFQNWRGPFVPGLERLGQGELIALLNDLHRRGRLVRTEQVLDWDPAEYDLRWTRTRTAQNSKAERRVNGG